MPCRPDAAGKGRQCVLIVIMEAEKENSIMLCITFVSTIVLPCILIRIVARNCTGQLMSFCTISRDHSKSV
jgi:hypothetical protein